MKRTVTWLMVLTVFLLTGCNSGTTDSNDTNTVSPKEQVVEWETIPTPLNVQGHLITIPLIAFMPDGRMIAVEGGDASDVEIVLETKDGSRVFEYVLALNPEGLYDIASFVEPIDNNTVLVGTTNSIWKVDVEAKTKQVIAVTGNYEAKLVGRKLYFTRGFFDPDFSCEGRVSVLDLDSGTISDIITGIPGSSAGVCLDDAGNIYTGNGYTNWGIPDETGLIKSFSPESLPAVWNDGKNVCDVLSGDSLIWLGNGVLLTGGGDLYGTSGDYNYFAAIDTTTGDILWKQDPDSQEKSYYKLATNSVNFAAYIILDYKEKTGVIYVKPLSAVVKG